ncbi:MAG: hypothetical protein ACRENU_00370 [Gemmatimonadaceae bacterium]
MLRSTIGAIALCLGGLSALTAQANEEQAVLSVVQRVFDGMRAADSAMIRAQFAGGARFAMVDNRATPPKVAYDSINGWLSGVARSANRWDEQIYDVQTRIDLGIAQVWAPYTFYLDKKVLHCGVNMFQLLKAPDGWKITQLSDSRRREGCPDPLKK